MYLNSIIENIVKAHNADFLGFANLEERQTEVNQLGSGIVSGYKYGISIGIGIPDSIVDHLPGRHDMDVAGEYRLFGYTVLNERLNMIASEVASVLSRHRYRTLPLTAADRNDELQKALVSHKMIARFAGLGWIGKNCLLITKERGPRVRFISVLTNAPLETTEHIVTGGCGNCTACVDICPVQAIKGREFDEKEERELRIDYERCLGYLRDLAEKNKHSVCGMCLYVCPYGRKNSC